MCVPASCECWMPSATICLDFMHLGKSVNVPRAYCSQRLFMLPPNVPKAKRVKPDWSWAVEGYDWISKPAGDAYHIPEALADDPISVKRYARVCTVLSLFWRSMRRACAVPPCRAELPSNPLDSDLDHTHQWWKSHGCLSNGLHTLQPRQR